MSNKLTKTQLARIDASIADRKAFQIWWDDVAKRLPSYNSPEHASIAWAAWNAATNRGKVRNA